MELKVAKTHLNKLIRNDYLRRSRDLLLPKLISGEVGVEKMKVGCRITEEHE